MFSWRSSNKTNKPFDIFGLPREVRQQIILKAVQGIELRPKTHVTIHSLMQTCRALREDVLGLVPGGYFRCECTRNDPISCTHRPVLSEMRITVTPAMDNHKRLDIRLTSVAGLSWRVVNTDDHSRSWMKIVALYRPMKVVLELQAPDKHTNNKHSAMVSFFVLRAKLFEVCRFLSSLGHNLCGREDLVVLFREPPTASESAAGSRGGEGSSFWTYRKYCDPHAVRKWTTELMGGRRLLVPDECPPLWEALAVPVCQHAAWVFASVQFDRPPPDLPLCLAMCGSLADTGRICWRWRMQRRTRVYERPWALRYQIWRHSRVWPLAAFQAWTRSLLPAVVWSARSLLRALNLRPPVPVPREPFVPVRYVEPSWVAIYREIYGRVPLPDEFEVWAAERTAIRDRVALFDEVVSRAVLKQFRAVKPHGAPALARWLRPVCKPRFTRLGRPDDRMRIQAAHEFQFCHEDMRRALSTHVKRCKI